MERITDRISSRTAGSAGNPGSRTSQGRNRILWHLSWGSSQRLLQHNRHIASVARSANGSITSEADQKAAALLTHNGPGPRTPAAAQQSPRIPLGRGGIPYGASLDFWEYDIEIAENGMSDDEEQESVRQEALAEEQFLLVELPAALRKILAKAKGSEKLARKLVFGKLRYTGPEASFSSSHASVIKALDECFHVIVGKAAD